MRFLSYVVFVAHNHLVVFIHRAILVYTAAIIAIIT